MPNPFTMSDIRGFNRLVREVTGEFVDVVEDLHVTIAEPLLSTHASASALARGITGLVYRSIHGSTFLVSAGLDIVLAGVTPLVSDPPSTPQREAVLAAVNGVWGDFLTASDNPLAICMSLRREGQPLVMDRAALAAALPQATGKLLVLAHGLCMNDLQWSRAGHDHGAALERDLGYTSLYLHYNSGLHISTNGRRFAGLLEALVTAWPQPIEELVIIGHSMGGLVARSACYYGAEAGHAWMRQLRKLVFLGTPHHGSRLERVGNWVDMILGATLYTAPFRRLGRRRSPGITDLRYGNLLDEDWHGIDRFANLPDTRRHAPLPEDVQCYAIAASRGLAADHLKGRLVGDDMVSVKSALGRHKDPERRLVFEESSQWTGYNITHLDLLCEGDVYEQIRQWLAP